MAHSEVRGCRKRRLKLNSGPDEDGYDSPGDDGDDGDDGYPPVLAKNLLASIKSEPPRGRRIACFIDLLPESQRDELLEVQAAYKRGELSQYSKSELFERCRNMLGLTVCRSAFVNWLDGLAHAKA